MNEYAKPGKYYLGDPYIILPPKILLGIWGELYRYENGKFMINDTDYIVHNTHYGDGIFTDTKNRTYDIKSGTIALININLIEDNLKYDYPIFEFMNKINFIYDAGFFYIKSGKKYIQIDTRNMDEYNSDFEEHCENENGEYISNTIIHESDNDEIFCNLDDSDEDDKSDQENKLKEEKIKKKYFK